MNIEALEKNFTPFLGKRDGYIAQGSYLAQPVAPAEKQKHSDFMELTIHLKDPVLELAPGDDGLPDEERRKHAHACKERVLAAMEKQGSVLYVGHYFWHHQFLIYTYLQEHQITAIAVELSKIMEEVPVRCHLSTALREDANWEAMNFFTEK
ncbi:hypothetical protein [Leptospira idonii]|uniref:Uncharacterized protein n=1 Tax=Leptospira idonii TaxID=1193500 RepID=A0A4R9M4S0_9LEPT|nr:hypothetical protein [Leptospira idonii]TGN20961.1 hypothetical protein EHS15_00105 [Leptospira idonii]